MDLLIDMQCRSHYLSLLELTIRSIVWVYWGKQITYLKLKIKENLNRSITLDIKKCFRNVTLVLVGNPFSQNPCVVKHGSRPGDLLLFLEFKCQCPVWKLYTTWMYTYKNPIRTTLHAGVTFS